MYDRNFKPKIFTDITKPAKQSFSPNIGKLSGIHDLYILIEKRFSQF